jgi:electron transport complex protein RnfG
MTIVLTLISVVAGAALAYVNDLTAGPIRMIKEQELQDGIKAVLSADNLTVESTDEADGVIVYRTDKGTAVQATDPNGFGGKLTVLVGFDSKGTVQGYRVLESAETPGLGAKAGEWFQKGQKGDIIGMSPEKNNMTVSKDGGEVDAITASTITSRAFLRCVNAAYEALAAEDAQSGATRQAADNTNEED